MKQWLIGLTALLCCWGLPALAGSPAQTDPAAQVRHYPIAHAEPQTLLAALQVLYPDGEVRLALIDRSLVVRGTADQQAAIRGLIADLDHAPRNLRITLRQGLSPGPGSRSYGQPAAPPWSVAEGQTLTLQRGTTRQQPSHAGHYGGWVAVEEVPANLESIALRPQLLGNNRVRVTLTLQRLRHGRLETLDTTVDGALNAWLPLQGDSGDGTTRRYGTPTSTLPTAIRVELASTPDRTPD
ncbi:MAG TPA: hypothetical protein VL027_14505 [Spongiibacteraceae bacterium]|jgi:hypothetical protein|nr:hypothetical protein [Spongiibacteraceae bacterium]HUH39149.1 hypothetical protein [Spongiibacteraceae bacterium]